MSNFFTPDVYVEEVSLVPPSIAGVSTAIPAFIGYTEKALKGKIDVTNVPIRISTFLEYKEIFGSAFPTQITVETDDAEENIENITIEQPKNTLYYALDMYFKNGGGDCYVISVDSYEKDYTAESFTNGLDILSKEDEPTLIILNEAVNLSKEDYKTVCEAALLQCEELKDRFCIFDIQDTGTGVEDFRDGISGNSLKYGAAYTPFLQTTLNYVYADSDVKISKLDETTTDAMGSVDYEGIKVSFTGKNSDEPKFKINSGAGDIVFSISDIFTLTISGVPSTDGISAGELEEAWGTFIEGNDNKGFDIQSIEPATMVSTTSMNSTIKIEISSELVEESTLDTMKGTALYGKIINEIAKKRIVLPPSPAVAGVYAATDRQRGVWKAPANVSLNAVVAPMKKISSAEQESLNIDATSGKSINAIRSFVGKGTLVWGARTLAGNDNEWRYISVRRLFNFIEESTKKASYFAVFEPNDVATWLKVKAMIESFLYGIWQQGGLTGSNEEQAYFVNVGLGKTMTQQDILEGRMIVEIGIAAVRPAEFIILKFSHKLQEV